MTNKMRDWKPHEDEVLRANPNLNSGEILRAGILPGRSRVSIKQRRFILRCAYAQPDAWTPERDAQLRRLIEVDGRTADSAGQILGVTKNAVIGRCHRIGVELGASSRDRQRTAKPNPNPNRKSHNRNPTGFTAEKVRAAASRPWRPELLPPARRVTAPVSIGDIENNACRYIGDRPEILTIDTPIYCGQPSVAGAPYCPEHKALCYRPPLPRERHLPRPR